MQIASSAENQDAVKLGAHPGLAPDLSGDGAQLSVVAPILRFIGFMKARIIQTFAVVLFFLPFGPIPDVGVGEDLVNDKTIALAIENRMLRSDEVRSHSVRAMADKGIVKLTGKVDNLFASRQAVRIAAEVRGVKSVINQIVVETPSTPDDLLAERVVANLKTSGPVDSGAIKVTAKGGTATLSGVVESLAEKQLAEHSATMVKGVTAIENELEVASSETRTDQELQEEISSLIDHSAILDESKIEISVVDGIAELEGVVASLAQKRKAVELASIRGAAGVSDGALRVEWKLGDGMQRQHRFEALTDEKISSAIKLAMKHHPLLVSASEKVEVSVDGAYVTLGGEVSRLVAKEAVDGVARQTIGVQGVKNRIRVVWPDDPPSDMKLTEMTARAMRRDGYLTFSEIIPRTRNAHVHLYGVVDTEFEKARAGQIAGSQPGVVHVANFLTVLGEWDPQPDAEIEQSIREQVALMATAPHVDVRINVRNGVPVLSGHVATWFQWQGLVDICQKAGGRRPHIDVDIHYRPNPGSPDLYVPQ